MRAKRRRLIPIDRMHLKLGDLIMFKAKDSLGFGTWYRGIVTKVRLIFILCDIKVTFNVKDI